MKKPLDYEELPAGKKVSVVIEAISDNGLKTSTATIDVAVQDLNDNPPVFEEDVCNKTKQYLIFTSNKYSIELLSFISIISLSLMIEYNWLLSTNLSLLT